MALSRTTLRATFLAVVLVCSSVLLLGVLTAPSSSAQPADGSGTDGFAEPVAPPRADVTVISTDSNVWFSDEGDGPRAKSELVAFAPNGSVLYYNSTHNRYWDVDPSPLGARTVLYTASDHLNRSACNATTPCTRNVVERVNLTTGAVTRLYSRITPYKHSTRWHDVDRLDGSRFVVADIHRDRVFVVDADTGLVEWSWNAQSAFPIGGGGPFPRDWTHLNDVDVLDDGRFMISLRNQDQVVFVDPETGYQANWTLGSEDDYDVLYEQHNPDYIPVARGGPAVLVADSENNRVVEYGRDDGTWNRTWEWSDGEMQWPRDADRLPDGHTLITDSNGNRVFEVDRNGEIVWRVDVAFPYEAERLGTGDGSANGSSAASLGLPSVNRTTAENASGEDGAERRSSVFPPVVPDLVQLLPGTTGNAVAYVLPFWMGPGELLALIVLCSSLLAWVGLEAYWSRLSVGVRTPIVIELDRGGEDDERWNGMRDEGGDRR